MAAKEGIPLSILLAMAGYTFGGPRHSLLNTMIGTASMEKYTIDGYVAPGFESIRKAFENNFKKGYERGAQFVVYHRGEKVVDIYGAKDSELNGYDGDSIQICFSCSKVLTSIVVAMAVEKGLIDYDENVSRYWPEFAANGKDSITVADVCRHDSGLAFFKDKIPLHLCHRESMDELAEYLAAITPTWGWKNNAPDEEKSRLYHGLTRGFILNEIVRRTDPKCRSVGQIIKEELAEPYGETIVMGKPTESERSRIQSLRFEPVPHVAMKTLWKKATGDVTEDERLRDSDIATKGLKSNILSVLAPVKMPWHVMKHDNGHYMNHPEFHETEMPSANAISNARALGRLADLMSRGKLLTKLVHDLAHSEPVSKFDHALGMSTTFTKGGWCLFEDEGWDDMFKGYVGWGGYGGSMFAWNPENETGVAYTMNGTYFKSVMGFKDDRCKYLMRHLIDAVKKISPTRSSL
eukprot:CAMPEP_0204826480 /NCGR_PEP_ID=MMETSP1346-20131115/4159_1 /ASSEMBLY_ACC=CAM_ASM_000771 /TAXON_ID=215587 /ORGANISM="Aplanochytrium stocchinoi, Strain GSBS06" /LENGTH=463 /DNA_ID=CAMNT_0051954525 /DNA_START=110 /DNA_END=1501 /DNA_ORIENTATION=+